MSVSICAVVRACLMVGLGQLTVFGPAKATAQEQAVASQAYHWRNVAIVGGGFVSGIITHPGAKGVMYARTDVGGAYRFDPATKSWVAITDWVPASEWTYTGIESMAVDPS